VVGLVLADPVPQGLVVNAELFSQPADHRLRVRLPVQAHSIGVAPKAVHADRGTSMTSKPVAALLAELNIDRSHSRPRVSNDNPYSESAFKTLKHCPAFPERFGCIADARAFCAEFFAYYNHEHRHRGIGLHTPASVHFGTAEKIRAERARVLDAAYAANPDRFRRRPTPPRLPGAAWINQPPATVQTS
jgi:putative transposase